MIEAFWRDDPLDDKEKLLLEELFKAHRRSTMRQNPSSVALQVAMAGSGSFSKAVVAAISTLGWPHGPIEATYDFLERGDTAKWLCLGLKIPGWGSGFINKDYDPAWLPFHVLLESWPDHLIRINDITNTLHFHNKVIFPNASCYTATCARILGLPKQLSVLLFLAPRIEAWAELCYDQQRSTPQV